MGFRSFDYKIWFSRIHSKGRVSAIGIGIPFILDHDVNTALNLIKDCNFSKGKKQLWVV